jgi:hypothetical protein
MATKVVYNACPGSFSVSISALERMQELGYAGEFTEHNLRVYLYGIDRHNPILVQAVEELAFIANSSSSYLLVKYVSGPYRIENYDGSETVMEPDDYEWITP